MSKPVIILDMDDVIADLLPAWVKVVNESEGEDVSVDDIKTWDIHHYFKCGAKVFEYLTSDLYRNLKPVEGSQDAVRKLLDKYEIYVCTIGTKHKQSLIPKYEWLEEHFPFIPISNLVLLGNKKMIKGDVMIDDGVKNFEGFEGRKLLFDCVHNQENIELERVYGWDDILEKLK